MTRSAFRLRLPFLARPPSLIWCAQLIVATTLWAGVATNEYRPILDRNVFGLTLAPSAPMPEPESRPAVRIKLTGITTILGDKRALFKFRPATNPGQPPPPEQSCILAVGQSEAGIEILSVDERTGDVTLNNGGIVMTLNIEKDGAKLNANLTQSPADLPLPMAVFPHPHGVYHRALFPGRDSI